MPKKHLFFLLAILALGAFLRFYFITEIPPGLYPDEAMNGNNALEALATDDFKVFYPENNGREGLFINIQALSLALFGNTPWALRVVSALFGTLTIIGMYLVTKELFRAIPDKRKSDFPRETSREKRRVGLPRGEIVALLSAFFLATSYWHINFSRIGFRAIMVPFFAVFGMYFLLKGLRRNSTLDLVLAGISTGLGLHTYIAFRLMAPVIAVPLAAHLWQWHKKSVTDHLPPTKPATLSCAPCAAALFAFIVLVVALPLGLYFIDRPQAFTNRAGEISVFAAASPLKEFAKSTALTAGMLIARGDCNSRHNFNCAPALNPLVAIFVLVGIIVLLKSHFNRRKSVLITAWTISMMLPVVLTRESVPHALRAIGMIPPLMILAGLGADRIRMGINQWIEKEKIKWPQHARQIARLRYELLFLFFLILLIVPLTAYRAYFLRWSSHPKTYEAFDASSYHLGQFLAGISQGTKKYVVVNTRGVDVRGIPMPAQTVMFVTDSFTPEKQAQKNIRYIATEPGTAPGEIASLQTAGDSVIAFIDGGDAQGIAAARRALPTFKIQVPGDFVILQNF